MLASFLALVTTAMPGHAADTDFVVMPFASAKGLLSQCSRSAPPIGDSGWTPTSKDIATAEAALSTALRSRRDDLRTWPKGWGRQYVGMRLKGHHVIYGNFFPKSMADEFKTWRTRPVAVCDGGVSFFGALYDVDTHKIVTIDYNGYA